MPQVSITLDGLPCVDPRLLAEDLQDGLEYDENTTCPDQFAGRANSFRSPRGPLYGRGWVLLSYQDLQNLDLDATDHTLTFALDNSTVSFENLTVIKTEAILSRDEAGAESVYLLELVDCRYYGKFTTVDRQYNVRFQEATIGNSYTPAQPYYLTTTNSGTAWTWQQMFEDLWERLPTIFGSPPNTSGLWDATTPEDYRFVGVNLWDAIQKICSDQSVVLSLLPSGDFIAETLDVPNSTVEQTLNTAFQQDPVDASLDLEPVVGLAPSAIRVYFRAHYYPYQGDITTDAHTVTEVEAWELKPAWYIEVSATDAGYEGATAPGTILGLWSSTTALFDQNSPSSPYNNSALNTEANTIAAYVLNTFTTADRYSHGTFGGVWSLSPCSSVAVVSYFDYGTGLFTQYIRAPRHFDPDAFLSSAGSSDSGHESAGSLSAADALGNAVGNPLQAIAQEYPGPPDIGRSERPYPRIAFVKLTEKLNTGKSASADVYYATTTTTTITWTSSTASIEVWDFSGATLESGTYCLAVYKWQVGKWVVMPTGDTTPPNLFRFRLTDSLTPTLAGGTSSAPAVILDWNSGTSSYDDGTAITVVDIYGKLSSHPGFFEGYSGYYGFCCKLPDKDEYQIVYMEQQALFIQVSLNNAISGGGSLGATVQNYWYGVSPGSTVNIYDPLNLYNGAVSASLALCAWDNIRLKYVIIDMSQNAASPISLFYLNAPLTTGGSASATLRVWNVGAGAWQNTGASVTVYDSSNLVPAGVTLPITTLGVAFKSPQSGRYEIIAVPGSGGVQIVRFKLTAPLTLGGSATADTQVWDPAAGGGAGAYVTGDSITVVDYYGSLGRRGKFQGPIGRYGFAVILQDKDEYQILDMEETAQFSEFQMGEDMGASVAGQAGATLSSTNFWHGQDTQGQITIYDPLGIFSTATNGQHGIVTWDEKRENYIALAMTHKAHFVYGYLAEDMGHTTPHQAAFTQVGYFQGTNPSANLAVDTLEIYDQLQTGDNVLLVYDDRSKLYRIADAKQQVGSIQWARTYASHNLDTDSKSLNHYVECQAVSNSIGSDYDSGSAHFNVYLPSPSSATDPNVEEDTIIGYTTDKDGRRVCVTDYLDECRGSIKIWSGSAPDIPHGWSLCDGSGTTPNLQGKFILGARPGGGDGPFDNEGSQNDIGDTGGVRKHTHKSHLPDATSSVAPLATSVAAASSLSEFIGFPVSLDATPNMTGSPIADGNTTETELTITTTGGTITTGGNTEPLTLSGHTHTVGIIGIHEGTGGVIQPDWGTTAGPNVDLVDPDPHYHEVNLDDLGISLSPNGHSHRVTVPVTGITFSPTILEFTPEGYVYTVTSVSVATTVASHFHMTPTLAHSQEYHVPEYYALCYIMRTD